MTGIHPDTELIWCSPVSSHQLSFYRTCCTIFLILINIISIATWELLWYEIDGDSWYYHFMYFTNWTLTITTLYFALASRKREGRLARFTFLLNTCAVPFSLLCTIVYWCIIFQSHRVFHTSHGYYWLPLIKEISVHGGTFILLIGDHCITSIRYRTYDVIYVIIFGLCYHLFATLLYMITGTWLYPFLNWIYPTQWIIMYVLFMILFVSVLIFQKLRDRWMEEIQTNDAYKPLEEIPVNNSIPVELPHVSPPIPTPSAPSPSTLASYDTVTRRRSSSASRL